MEKITQKTKVNKDSKCWAAEKVNEKWFGFLDIVDFFPLPFFFPLTSPLWWVCRLTLLSFSHDALQPTCHVAVSKASRWKLGVYRNADSSRLLRIARAQLGVTPSLSVNEFWFGGCRPGKEAPEGDWTSHTSRFHISTFFCLVRGWGSSEINRKVKTASRRISRFAWWTVLVLSASISKKTRLSRRATTTS